MTEPEPRPPRRSRRSSSMVNLHFSSGRLPQTSSQGRYLELIASTRTEWRTNAEGKREHRHVFGHIVTDWLEDEGTDGLPHGHRVSFWTTTSSRIDIGHSHSLRID